jgi:Domain of unknown function (DUF5671)
VLFFNYLDLLLPDPAWDKRQFSEEATRSAIRWSLASVIISFPLFFGMARMITGEVRRNAEKAKSAVRKWLAYLGLFVGSVTLMIDLISLLYYLLEGALSTRIILKVTVLCVIVGMVCWYYLMTLRTPGKAKV